MNKVLDKPNKRHIQNNVYIVPKGITEISEKAFMLDESGICNAIQEIRFNYELKKIGSHAFFDCLPEVKSLGYLGKVEAIGECAFWGLDSLERVILTPNIKTIGKHAFCNCIKLTILFLGSKEDIPKTWHKDWNPNCKIEFSGDWVLLDILCPTCKKDSTAVYAVKNKKNNKLCVYCEECDSLWETPADVFKTEYKTFGFEWDGNASLDEVREFGWEQHISTVWLNKKYSLSSR